MGLAQILPSVQTFFSQLSHTLWYIILRLLTRSKPAHSSSELPVAVDPHRAAGDLTESSKVLSLTRGPSDLGDVPLSTLESGHQSQARRARKERTRTPRARRLAHDFFPPAAPMSPRDPTQVRDYDAVLNIIDAVIQSHCAGDFQDVSLTEATQGCPVTAASGPVPNPPSTPSSSSSYSTSSTPETSVVATPPHSSATQSPVSSDAKQDLPVADPAIGGLGKRRGFKGAPLRIRGSSLPRKISSSLLGPLSPFTPREFLPFVMPLPTPSTESERLLHESFLKADPFAMKTDGPFYVPGSLSTESMPMNLDNFSVYRCRSRHQKHTAQYLSAQSHKDLFNNKMTKVYDMSIYSYGMRASRAKTDSPSSPAVLLTPPSPSGDEVEHDDPETGPTAGDEETALSGPQPESSASVVLGASLSQHASDAASQATSLPGPTTVSPVSTPEADGTPPSDNRRISSLRLLILPQRHSLTESSARILDQLDASDARPQALEDIIGLLNFKGASVTELVGREGGPTVKGPCGSPIGCDEEGVEGVVVVVAVGCNEVYAI